MLTSPTNGAHYPYGEPIPISLTTTTNEGQVTFATFWDYGLNLGLVTNSPYTFLWTNAPPGDHDIAGAVLSPSRGYISAHGSALITVGPPNDDFAHPQIINGIDGLIGTFLGGATAEPGEPPPTSGATNSVWLSWTAPSSGVVTLFGGDIDHFTFDIFTGDSLANLVLLTNALNSVTFDAIQGETYSVRVSGSAYLNNAFFHFFLSSFEITSPLPGAQFTAGTDIPITIDFTERDQSIRNVKFYANDVPIGTVYDSPFSFVWSNVVAGSYELRAVGTNDVDFLFHSSAPVPITVLPP